MLTAVIYAATTLAVATIVAFCGLKAWRGWLDLRRYEIAAARSDPAQGEAETGTRIELAGIKERLRKLEAIATGVDL